MLNSIRFLAWSIILLTLGCLLVMIFDVEISARGTPGPSDKQTKNLFFKHENEFQELLLLIESEEMVQTVGIAILGKTQLSSKRNPHDADLIKNRITRERYEKYVNLLDKLGAASIKKSKWAVEISLHDSGIVPNSWSVSVVYRYSRLDDRWPLVKDTVKATRLPQTIAYSKLHSNWFILREHY